MQGILSTQVNFGTLNEEIKLAQSAFYGGLFQMGVECTTSSPISALDEIDDLLEFTRFNVGIVIPTLNEEKNIHEVLIQVK